MQRKKYNFKILIQKTKPINTKKHGIMGKLCSKLIDVIGTKNRGVLLTRKLLDEWFLVVKLKSLLRTLYGRQHDLVNRYGISVSQIITWYVPFVVITIRSFPHLWHITELVTRVTRRVALEEQELPTLPVYLSSSPSPFQFSGARVPQYLVFYVCFVVHCLSFCTFSIDHCIVCSSTAYD